MKITVSIFLLLVNICPLFSQPLFSFGNNTVSKEEFLRAYNKNKSTEVDKEKALKEYLDLYSKFKLKVRAAKDLRLDTLPQLTADLQNFRSQIEESYLTNDNELNNLIDEAFLNAQKDLHVIHFFAGNNAGQPPADSLKAAKAIQEVYKQLVNGKKYFEKIVAEVSVKYTKVKSSDLGYLTAFSVPYEFEKIIYGLKTGETSKPHRSKNGWHIFQVTEERMAMGKWKIAQILFANPPGDVNLNNQLLLQKADSIYLKLQAGADFGEMAKQYSDDKLTYLTGGMMPEFTTGKFEPVFEKEVFKLTQDNEISKPFITPFGVHIVKRLSTSPVQTVKTDPAYLFDLKQKVLQDSRVNIAKDLFSDNVIKVVGYKKNTQVKEADLFRYADSVALNPAANGAKEFPVSNKVILSNGKNNVKGSAWLNFIREYKTNPEIYKGETYRQLQEKFIAIKSLEYYKNNLENYNADFRFQMDEFKDGNLLFEIMERKVWSNAVNDSAGLKKYYNQYKNKYLWGASADVIIINCNNKKSAEESLAALNNGKDWKKIAEEGNNNIQADSGRYELSQIAFSETIKPVPGLITPITVNPSDGTSGFIKILRLHPANEQRTFEEARGLVINDYQVLIEEKWIAELKKKYPVKVNEKVFQSLLK